MSSDIAIKVDNISKCFQIYDKPHDRLKQFFLTRLQRFFGYLPKQYFREFWALRNVSLEVLKGESVGIVGRNGSGKSTLLQIICGTLIPTYGSTQTFGRVAALLELASGFNPEFTGHENVYVNATLLGLNRKEIDIRYGDICDFADIGEFIDQPVKTYSSGMMVRLAFAVVAHVDADILIIDEALSVGDAFFNQKCMRFIRDFQKRGGTLLFVSHDTSAVLNLCNKTIYLKKGGIAQVGEPKEVLENYLASSYGDNQEVISISKNEKDCSREEEFSKEYRDMRETLFNGSTLRNDIKVFGFNPDSSGFGTLKARIKSVKIFDDKGFPLSWVIGGELIVLEIQCYSYENISRPIVGFIFKDRLGQAIFSDNTYLAYKHKPQPVTQGSELCARFEFRLPILPSGDYSITAAIAEGTQENHVQHHWLHDALILKVQASSVCFGLIGVPMKIISLESRLKK